MTGEDDSAQAATTPTVNSKQASLLKEATEATPTSPDTPPCRLGAFVVRPEKDGSAGHTDLFKVYPHQCCRYEPR